MRSIAFLAAVTVFATIGGSLLLADEAEAVDYGAVLSPKDPTMVRFTEPGGTACFNWTLENTYIYGPRENVTLDVLGKPYLWQHFLAASTVVGVRTSTIDLELELSIHETANVSLTISVPLNADNGTYWMNLTVVVDEDPSVNHSSGFCVVVGTLEPWFGLARAPIDDILSAIPPSQLWIRCVLYNGGLTADRFQISSSSSRLDEGWTIEPNEYEPQIDESGWTPELPVDPMKANPYFIDLLLTIPAGAEPNLRCTCVISATSEKGQSPMSMTAEVVVASLQSYNFQVFYYGTDREECSAGEQATFQLRIQNKGNGVDTFTIKPVWDAELNPGFMAAVNPNVVEVPPNDTATVYYIVAVPSNAPKKVYFFKAEVYSSCEDLAVLTRELKVEVRQFFALELSSPNANAVTDPGGVIEFEVFVKNVGNGLDSIRLHLEGVPESWINYTQPDEHSLLQNEKGKSIIRIIVPSEFDEAPARFYRISVVAASVRSSSRANLTLWVEINQFQKIEWVYLDDPITAEEAPIAQRNILKPRRAVNPFQTDELQYVLELRNFGNGMDNVTIWAWTDDPDLTITVDPTTRSFDAGEVFVVRVRITFPREARIGAYAFYVNASSEDPTQPVRAVPIEFDLVDVDLAVPSNPTYTDPLGEGNVTADLRTLKDESLVFELVVTNEGVLPVEWAWLECLDTYVIDDMPMTRRFFNQTLPEMSPGDRCEFSGRSGYARFPAIQWLADIPGNHTLEFRLHCGNQSDEGNDISLVNVTVEELERDVNDTGASWISLGLLSVVTIVIVLLVVARWFLARPRARG